VSLDRYWKQLRREATRNPKKAAILGGMLLVAVYFWAPLVAGWIQPSSGGAPPPPPTTAANLTGFDPTPKAASPKPAAPESVKSSWQELTQWMEHDPRTRPAAELAAARDPFHAVETAKPVEVRAAPAEVRLPSVESLGLMLSTTVVGGKRPMARINGKTYALGSAVEVSVDGQKQSYQLVEVRDRSVVLEREHVRFELLLPIGGRARSAQVVTKD